MPKKKITKARLPQLRKQVARLEKGVRIKISRLQRKKQTLQKQIVRVDEKIKELNKELGEKQKRKVGKKARGKKGKRARGERLGAGVMNAALVRILKADGGPMSPKDLRVAVIANKVYKNGPPPTLNKIIASALHGKEFRKVGKGKYALKGKIKAKAKGKPKKKAKAAAKKVPQKKAKGKVKKAQAKKAEKEKGKAKEEKKEEEKEKGE